MKAYIQKALFFIRAIWRGFRDAETEALILLLGVTLGIGTIFYSYIEHWNLLDSLYFTVITLTTVGYGDLAPKTDIGKIFTIVYVFAGLILILGFVNSIVKQTIESKTLKQVVDEEKFYKGLKKFKRK
ncbi:MAG: potassium channel family protein [Candidatus Diapherotrites archaeon]